MVEVGKDYIFRILGEYFIAAQAARYTGSFTVGTTPTQPIRRDEAGAVKPQESDSGRWSIVGTATKNKHTD